MPALFDSIAEDYDGWYDSPEGLAIFQEEARCLHHITEYQGRWLEVGVGTGRFASELGIAYGIDISLRMAAIAKRRGMAVQVGCVEQMPYQNSQFDGVLLALTLCFITNPELAFLECFRILRAEGQLVVGTIPADSPWGKAYIKKGLEGHPVYSHACFRTVAETIHYVEQAGFRLQKSCSKLFCGPDCQPKNFSRGESGIVAGAGTYQTSPPAAEAVGRPFPGYEYCCG